VRHIKLFLQYDGTAYSGWQVQKRGRTIQKLIEDAIFKVTGKRVRVTGAGRTDAGVHALCQVAVFKTRSYLKPAVILRALNAYLPSDIRIVRTEECSAGFHPRFDAKNKTYSYIISMPGTGPASGQGGAVFLKRYSWQIPYDLNIADMRKAARHLIGKHDFACFRASGCSSKNALRNIKKLTVSKANSSRFLGFELQLPLIKISIQADAFLRHMVRNIVGTLVEVGRGKISPDEMQYILDSKDRRLSGPNAPAQGLFLEKIVY
jgi:tRNA pseudouridine38-40 synthase